MFQPSKNSAVTPMKWKIVKNGNWDNKIGYTISAATCDPRSVENTKKLHKSEKIITHKYNTISITKRVNRVKKLKNAPKMFKMDATEKIK